MNKKIHFLLILILPLAISFAEEADFIDRYLKKQIDVDIPYQVTHSSEYYIFAAQEDTPERLSK